MNTAAYFAEKALMYEAWGLTDSAAWHARQMRVALGVVKPVPGKDLAGLSK